MIQPAVVTEMQGLAPELKMGAVLSDGAQVEEEAVAFSPQNLLRHYSPYLLRWAY